MTRLSLLRALLLGDEGRINRSQFWLYVAGAVIFVLSALLLLPTLGVSRGMLPLGTSLLLLYPSYCVIAKRLQDVGIDGQWAMLMVIVAAIDSMWTAIGPGLSPAMVLVRDVWWWISLANSLVFIAIGLWPGESGSNTYGPQPD